MKRIAFVWQAAVVIFMFGLVANAAPITYNESVSGDLQSTCPCNVFAFDLGINSISGTTFVNAVLPTFDFDSFAFSIPAGMQLTQVTYSFVATFSGAIVTSATDEYLLYQGNTGLPSSQPIGDQSVNFLAGSPVAFFNAPLPLGNGTYTVKDVTKTVSSNGNWSVAYRWDYTVSAVPEPGTLTLVCLGLTSLFLFRPRKQ